MIEIQVSQKNDLGIYIRGNLNEMLKVRFKVVCTLLYIHLLLIIMYK